MKKKSSRLARVDLQVSVLTAAVVLGSVLSVFFVCYQITYGDMIASLNDRVTAIHSFLEKSLDMKTFEEINSAEDMDTPLYQKTNEMLENIKNTTGVMYLYTAKENSEGELIYVVDGLDPRADFRYPGDKIEEEIEEDLRRALNGEVILPNKIKSTDWGKIFITYLPIHNGEEIVGAVGIEFEAEHQYNTYYRLKTITPILSLLFCLVAIIIALIFFRRISNPYYRDIANTDFPTKFKNRNAFETDMNNLAARKNIAKIGFVSIDLNNLKKVNDTLGHSMGDRYIYTVSEVLRSVADKHMILYRVGGDEFVVIIPNADELGLALFEKKIHKEMDNCQHFGDIEVSIAVGSSMFDQDKQVNLYDAYKKADEKMYENKKQYHMSVCSDRALQ